MLTCQLAYYPIKLTNYLSLGNGTECVEGENLEDSIYLAVFIIGQLCNGIGGSALYTLAVPYMDSNIRIRDTPLYIGEILSSFL